MCMCETKNESEEGTTYVKEWVDDFLEGRAVAPARADELGEDARVLHVAGRGEGKKYECVIQAPRGVDERTSPSSASS